MSEKSTLGVTLITKKQSLTLEEHGASSSPFQPLSRVLRAFQLLGIFNFSTRDNCSRFVHRPIRFTYSLLLNALVLLVPIGFNLLWFHASKMSLEELQSNVSDNFSKTDFVALGGVLFLLQVATLGLHVSNMELGHHLNKLVAMEGKLGIMSGEKSQQHPSTWKLLRDLGMILTLLVSSQFMIGYSFTSIIGFIPSLPLKFCLGLSQSLAVTYLHLTKICCETLFLRMVHVLEFHYKRLLDKMEQRNDIDEPHNYLLDHMLSLGELFKSVESAFQRQLLIQHSLIMGALIFGTYLSISFVISSNAGSDQSHLMFTVGFMLYSLVPAVRLIMTASSVDQVIVKIHAIRMHLYEMEASAKDKELKSKIHLTIMRYKGIDGFSACNYFTVNPQLFTSIMGYLTTYIIVMIQFKLADITYKKINV